MNELFGSIRADLTDRRLLPVVGLVVACLVAAIAYAALGGGSSSPAREAGTIPTVAPTSGIAATAATPEHAVAETTDGVSEQRNGHAHNPFTPLVAGTPTTTPTAPSSGAGNAPAAGSGAGGGETSGPSAGSEPSSPGKEEGSSGKGESKPKKPKTVYDVTIDFGTLPPGVTPETAKLTQFDKLKLQTVLPTPKLPILVFRGVTAKGKAATFTVVGEAFLSGTGSCLPSATQCEAVDLKPGETEQLSFLNADGTTTIYELRVLSIKAEDAKAKNARAARWSESRAGRALLRASGLEALPFLRYSTEPGVLVFAPVKASAARAHTALVASVG